MTKNPKKTDIKRAPKGGELSDSTNLLLRELRGLIEQSRQRVAQQVNTELVTLYWHIGERIGGEILKQERAEYGKQVLATLGRQLTFDYGRGFDRTALTRMVKFAELFPDWKIVATLSHKLGWSHFIELLPLDNELKRNFYAEMCGIEGWSVRTLRDKIKRMLFERTAIAKKPEDVAEQEVKLLQERGELTPDLVFRDPYLLDFLGLSGAYDEKDVETAILREMEQFLLELGTHFSFIARQKRILVGDNDYYLDLLFFHRRLKRLVAIELKLTSFKPEYKGQMELYLRWLDKYERCEGEETPVGLILCAGKSRTEEIELLALDESDIRVAEFITDELPKSVLASKLHEAIKHARQKLTDRAANLKNIDQKRTDG
jgi:predicted nuclease of restriction endonuclease-like (RecB) superfamily